jgi:hypothetical protein
MRAFLAAAALLLAVSATASAQQSRWLWWGTNPTTAIPVSSDSPLPVTIIDDPTLMKIDASNATLPDARTNLGLGTGSSPVFTGLTLSGLTAGSIPFAGTAGLISQNNTNLGWNDTDHIFRLGPNIAGTGFGGTGAVATQSYTNLTPPALILGFTQHITGLGNNTDFLGVGGIDTTVFDDTSVATGTRGVLYGHSITLKPLLSRTNSPADDATGLAIQNGSTNNSRATDALYVGHTAGFTAGALEWQCLLCTGANANFGVRIGGTIAFYPFDASQATITKSAFYAANNVPTLGASNAAGNADVEIARVNASNLVSLASGAAVLTPSGGTQLVHAAYTGTTLPTQAAGTLGIGGIASFPTFAANGEGDILLSTTNGLILAGQGSTNDFVLANKIGFVVASNPTGTNTFKMFGPAIAADVVQMPGLAASSAATTGTVCWTTSTGNLTVDTTTTCLASSMRFKHDWQATDPQAALAEVMRYKPGTFLYNDDLGIPGVQSGFTAEDMAEVNPDLVVFDENGKPLKVKTLGIIAKLASAIQALEKRTR